MKLLPVAILRVIALSLSCGKAIPIPFHPDNKFTYLPASEVIQAAAKGPEGFTGAAEFRIRSIGEGKGAQSGFYFLNSELDYGDPKCLTVDLPPQVVAALREKRRLEPMIDFLGRKLQAKGTAKQVKIGRLTKDGQPSGEFHFQTHITIDSPDQIAIVSQLVPAQIPHAELPFPK